MSSALLDAPSGATLIPSPVAHCSLPTGDLTVRVERASLPLETLCDFAARRNPKRGFLFVSRVLGRHWPARPRVMRDVQARLARRIPADLPGPVLVVGMAETAICLGQGVHEEYVRQAGRDDTVFVHSTRYPIDAPLALRFQEEHSHATDHLLYWPAEAEASRRFREARSLVLVDDEMSTGKTFVNLARAFGGVVPRLERLVGVVITDWSGEARRQAARAQFPVSGDFVSLLEGEYEFTPRAGAVLPPMPNVAGSGEEKSAWISADYGRQGGTVSPERVEAMAAALFAGAGERVLVLGTGEFVHPPFLLAEALERRGAEVWVQATTRSPALLGHAMGSLLEFGDNYGDQIPNFLYNVTPGQYGRVLLCHETPAGSVDPDLIRLLGAELVQF